MKKAALAVLFLSLPILAQYSPPHKVASVQSKPNELSFGTPDLNTCSGYQTVFQLTETDARYKNFLSILLTSMSSGVNVVWYKCGCSGSTELACVDYLKASN